MMTRFSAEVATATGTALFGLAILIGAREFGTGWGSAGPEAGTFPFYIGLIIVLASLGTLAQCAARRRALAGTFLTAEQFRAVLGFFLPFAGFVALAVALGLYVATAIYMFATLRFQNGYGLGRALAIALALPVFLFAVLEYGFSVPLLKGPLETMLGM